MRHHSVTLLTALLSLSICIAPAADEPPAEPPAQAPEQTREDSIGGRVIGADDAPAAGATVRLLPNRPVQKGEIPAKRVLTADEEGRFRVDGLDVETCAVRVEAQGYAPFSRSEVEVGTELEVRLQRGHGVEGHVFDIDTGKTLPGARVRLCDRIARSFGDEACLWVETDEDGRFAGEHLPEGHVVLTAVTDAHAYSRNEGVTLPLDPDEPREPIALRLGPGGRLSGRVVDSRGKPLEAWVTLSPAQRRVMGHRPGKSPTIMSDEKGVFLFEGVPAGFSYRIEALKRGFPSVESGPYLMEQGAHLRDIEILLLEGAVLVFRLVDEDGRPVEDEIELRLRDLEGEPVSVPFGMAGVPVPAKSIAGEGDGVYRASSLEHGEYALVLQPSRWAAVRRERVVLHPGTETDLGAITLDPGLSIAGIVSDPDGTPIEGARVSAQILDELGTRRRATSSEPDGRYEIGGLGEQPLSLEVSARNHAPAGRQQVVPGDEAVDFTLEPAGSIRGVALLEDGNAPPSFVVKVHPETEGPGAFSSASWAARMRPGQGFGDPEGKFRIDDVAAGTYTVEVKSPGMALARKTGVEVASGEDADAGTLTLKEGISLRGTVLALHDDSPIAGVRVEPVTEGAVFDFRPDSEREAVLTDSDGGFELTGLVPGAIGIRATHRDFAPGEASVSLTVGQDTEPVTIRLSGGGTLAGIVRSPEGEPVANAKIVVMRGMTGAADAESAMTGPDGRYELRQLSPGSYQVMRFRDDGAFMNDGIKAATIRESETTIVNFGDAARINLSGTVLRGNEPVPDAAVIFIPGGAVTPAGFRTTQTDAFGRYRIGLEEPGRYAVTVRRPTELGGGTPLMIEVPDREQVSQDIVLNAGTVSGAIMDAEGNPVPHATVTARREGAAPEDVTGFAAAQADAGGRFELSGLGDGTYDVVAAAEGYQPSSVPGVSPGASGLEIQLHAGRMVRGRVVDPQGQGVAGAIVVAAPAGSAHTLQSATTQTDVNGGFGLTAPADGPLDFTALSGSWAPARRTGVIPSFDTDAPGLTLVATSGGRLSVRVTDAQGQPASGIQVVVRAVPPFLGSDFSSVFQPPSPTDADGWTRADRLAPGSYQIQVSSRPGAAVVPVQIQEGVEATSVFQLP